MNYKGLYLLDGSQVVRVFDPCVDENLWVETIAATDKELDIWEESIGEPVSRQYVKNLAVSEHNADILEDRFKKEIREGKRWVKLYARKGVTL